MTSSTFLIGKALSYMSLACVHRDLSEGFATLTLIYRAVSRGIASNMQQPVNSALESGLWTQSIIWDRRTPFLDFTQLQLDDDEDALDSAAGAAAEAKKEKEGQSIC